MSSITSVATSLARTLATNPIIAEQAAASFVGNSAKAVSSIANIGGPTFKPGVVGAISEIATA